MGYRLRKFLLGVRSIKPGIRNIVRWMPIIWKDEDWDHMFFSDMMLKKLKFMRAFFQSEHTVSLDALVYAKEIDEVIKLLEKVERDEYELEIDPHFDDWMKIPMQSTKQMIENSQNTTSRLEVYRRAAKNKAADIEKAYSLIGKNLQNWWD